MDILFYLTWYKRRKLLQIKLTIDLDMSICATTVTITSSL